MDNKLFVINFNMNWIDNIGINSDNSINIKNTLTNMKNDLMNNVTIINHLLEKSNHVNDLIMIDDVVSIKISDPNLLKKLLKLKVIVEITDEDSYSNTRSESDSESEEHKSDVKDISSSSSSEDLVTDDRYKTYIMNKYKKYINI